MNSRLAKLVTACLFAVLCAATVACGDSGSGSGGGGAGGSGGSTATGGAGGTK